MYDIPASLIAALLLVVVLAVLELAFRIGRRTQAVSTEDSKGHINAIQASTLGILALILAFTFSLSLQRFETRSDAVVDEANAIGTAYLRAQLLPASLREDVRRLLREYVDLRVRAGTVTTNDEDGRTPLLAKATGVQDSLWEYARRSAEIEPNPVTSGLFIQSLNELIDSFGRRDAAINRHVPEVVLFLLIGTFVLTAAIVGFGAGVVGQRPSWVSVRHGGLDRRPGASSSSISTGRCAASSSSAKRAFSTCRRRPGHRRVTSGFRRLPRRCRPARAHPHVSVGPVEKLPREPFRTPRRSRRRRPGPSTRG